MFEDLNQQLWYLLLFLGSILLNIVFVLVIWGMNRQRLHLQRHMLFALEDHSGDNDGEDPTPVFGEVSIDSHGNWLQINVAGYSENEAADGHGCVVFLEYYDKELRLYYTDDLNDIHQPHKIVLEGARISNRIETERDYTQ